MVSEAETALLALIQQQQQWMEQVLQRFVGGPQASHHNVSSFPPFDKVKDRWDSFCRLNQHFKAHQVQAEHQKRAYFLSWVGAETFELLQKLNGDIYVSTQTYSVLVDSLSHHFKSKTHVLAARYEFYRSHMKPDQKYSDWVADLWGIARDCRFTCEGSTCELSFVDGLIRDQIVLNMPYDQVRASALQYNNPSLEEVLKVAEAYEVTQRTVKTIKGDCEAPQVHQMSSSYKKSTHQTTNTNGAKAAKAQVTAIK